jgi:hypothetical protein
MPATGTVDKKQCRGDAVPLDNTCDLRICSRKLCTNLKIDEFLCIHCRDRQQRYYSNRKAKRQRAKEELTTARVLLQQQQETKEIISGVEKEVIYLTLDSPVPLQVPAPQHLPASSMQLYNHIEYQNTRIAALQAENQRIIKREYHCDKLNKTVLKVEINRAAQAVAEVAELKAEIKQFQAQESEIKRLRLLSAEHVRSLKKFSRHWADLAAAVMTDDDDFDNEDERPLKRTSDQHQALKKYENRWQVVRTLLNDDPGDDTDTDDECQRGQQPKRNSGTANDDAPTAKRPCINQEH